MTTIPPLGNAPPGTPPLSSSAATRNTSSLRPNAPTPTEGVSAITQETTASTSAASKQAERENVERAVQQVRKAIEPVARNLRFSIDEETGRTIVKIVDDSTKEVIRQIPSEELLDIARALDKAVGDATSGLFVKQKA